MRPCGLISYNRYRQLIGAGGYGSTAMDIAEWLIGQPYVTVPMLRKRIGKSDSAIRNALSRLVTLGIVGQHKYSGGCQYAADDVLMVMSASRDNITVDAPLLHERTEE